MSRRVSRTKIEAVEMTVPMRSWQESIRKLAAAELHLFQQHLLRLDRACRRSRFGSEISDTFLRDYAMRLDPNNTLVLGCFDLGGLRAAGELRSLKDHWCGSAEAAFTVERDWHCRGIGKALMATVTRASEWLGVETIHMIWHFTNRPMHRIAESAGAWIDHEGPDCVGKIVVQKRNH